MKQITIDRIFYIVFGFIFIFTGVLGYSSWGNYPGDTAIILGWQVYKVTMMIFSFVSFVVGIGLMINAILMKEKIKSNDVVGEKGE